MAGAPGDDLAASAGRIGSVLVERGGVLGVAESLTGGMVATILSRAEGSSDWFAGGVVAYRRSVKHDVLGVPPGPVVTERAAVTMAEGVASLLGVDIGVGLTGAGGPDPQDGAPPGTVWIAVHHDGATTSMLHHFDDDDPSVVCRRSCAAALALVEDVLDTG